jgi:hypothetical protein
VNPAPRPSKLATIGRGGRGPSDVCSTAAPAALMTGAGWAGACPALVLDADRPQSGLVHGRAAAAVSTGRNDASGGETSNFVARLTLATRVVTSIWPFDLGVFDATRSAEMAPASRMAIADAVASFPVPFNFAPPRLLCSPPYYNFAAWFARRAAAHFRPGKRATFRIDAG